MKKFLSFVLAVTLLAGLTAFASADAAKTTPSIAIVVAGSLGDRSFYDSANEGLTQLAADFGTVITYRPVSVAA